MQLPSEGLTVITASSLALSDLRQTFGLSLNPSDRFFDEWLKPLILRTFQKARDED